MTRALRVFGRVLRDSTPNLSVRRSIGPSVQSSVHPYVRPSHCILLRFLRSLLSLLLPNWSKDLKYGTALSHATGLALYPALFFHEGAVCWQQLLIKKEPSFWGSHCSQRAVGFGGLCMWPKRRGKWGRRTNRWTITAANRLEHMKLEILFVNQHRICNWLHSSCWEEKGFMIA